MPYVVELEEAQKHYPEFAFVRALSPSEQKAAFEVRNKQGARLCLKLIAPDCRVDRVEREVLAMQLVDHPNVAKIRNYEFSLSENKRRHFIAEEFVDGVDLEEVVARAPLGRKQVAGMFAMVCDGLAAIHQLGIVHRDMKPRNVRVTPDGTPVIVDFGLARHLSLPDVTRTSAGAGIGTPLYFAPEQFVGNKHDIDPRTDVFAVGVIMYRALTGEHPFFQNGMLWDSFMGAVVELNPFKATGSYRELPPVWQLVVSRTLEKSVARRPRADQLAALLRSARST